jgi:RNA polymerase sigma factor (sigma-70 family)
MDKHIEMTNYSDQAILNGILRKDEEVLKYAYREFYPMVRFFVLRNNGNVLDAEDVFQEAIIAIFERLRRRDLKLECSLRTFMYAISRHMWLQKLNRGRLILHVAQPAANLAADETEMYDVEKKLKKRIFQRNFLLLSENCQKILNLFIEERSFDEIATEMGFKNKQYAIKRKYECTKTLYERIQNDPEYKSLLL